MAAIKNNQIYNRKKKSFTSFCQKFSHFQTLLIIMYNLASVIDNVTIKSLKKKNQNPSANRLLQALNFDLK